MIQKIRAYIDKYQLLSPGRPVIVALSGGADSVALADILVRLGYSAIALHCNFHLRQDESQRDETFARTFAQNTLGIPFHKKDFDTTTYAARRHLSIEMAAREQRYAWFEEMRRTHHAQAIAVAHHRDDSVETLLLNLVRGSGLRGLTGIRPRNGQIIRPLLAVSRDDILDWLSVRGLGYVTDSTNLTDAYTRNFIRHRIIPLLEEINPAARDTLARSAAHLASAEPIYDAVIRQARHDVMICENELSIQKLLAYPSPETVLYELLRPYGFSRPVAEAVFRSLDNISGKQFFSPAYRLIKDRDTLLLVPRLPTAPVASPKAGTAPAAIPATRTSASYRAAPSKPKIVSQEPARASSEAAPKHSPASGHAAICGLQTVLPDVNRKTLPAGAAAPNPAIPCRGAECYLLDEKTESFSHPVQLSWEKIVLTDGEAISLQEKYPFRERPDTACFDYEKLRFPLTLRRWQQGDWFIPFGMKGRKKVSDYFTDRKFSRLDKEKSWLLCSGNDILWIIGERTDNRFRITEETKIMLVVKISAQRDHHL